MSRFNNSSVPCWPILPSFYFRSFVAQWPKNFILVLTRQTQPQQLAADEINELMTDSKINGVTCGGIVVVVAVVVVFVDVAANIALVVHRSSYRQFQCRLCSGCHRCCFLSLPSTQLRKLQKELFWVQLNLTALQLVAAHENNWQEPLGQ